MNTAPVPISFTLEGGGLLVVSSGTRYEVISGRPSAQAWTAQDELIRLRERVARLLHTINAMRKLHGGDPIE